jgi:superkiller protein 3
MDYRSIGLIAGYGQMMGTYYLNKNDMIRAKKMFNMFKVYVMSESPHVYLGYVYYEKGLYNDAIQEYLKSIESGNKTADVYTNLGVVYEKTGQSKKSVDCYIQSVRLEPDNAQAHYNLAVAYWHQSDWNKVITEFETVLRLDPTNITANQYLSIAKSKMNRQ